MLLNPRTKKPTAVFWMIVALIIIIIYYFTTTNSESKSAEVNPKLLVNGPDVDREFQQELPEQNAPVIDAGGFGNNERLAAAQVPIMNQPQAVPDVQPIGNPVDVGRPVEDSWKPVVNAGMPVDAGVQQVVAGDLVNAVRPGLNHKHASHKNHGGFRDPLPQHRDPPVLRPGLEQESQMLDMGHGLNLPKDANPDYIDAIRNNENPENEIILPQFNPNRFVEHKKMEDYVSVKRPQPKSFPVGIIVSPTIESCHKPVVVVLVTTVLKESHVRMIIRRTWGRKEHADQKDEIAGDWKVIFLVGRPQNASENQAILKESQLNQDILQGDFTDMVEEVTRKVLMGMTWVVEKMSLQCQPLYVLRAESDMYINMPSIFKWLKTQPYTKVYLGHVIHRDFPNRDVESPYYVPKSDYPLPQLPIYANAPVYLISYDYVKRFVAAISSVTPIAMDGVYVGLLAEKVGAIARHNEHFVLMKRPSNPCVYKKMFFIFKIHDGEMIHVFQVVERHQKDAQCSRTGF